jgi:hypothetical protein
VRREVSGEAFNESKSRRSCAWIVGIRVGAGNALGLNQSTPGGLDRIAIGIPGSAASRFPSEAVLDSAIFEGVKGDDSQTSAWSQELHGLAQRGVELLELVIDRDADGLEAAGRWVRPAVVIAAGLGDTLGQGTCAVPRPSLKDGSGDASSPRFFAVVPEHPRELVFVHFIQPAARVELLVGVHSHIEGSISLKGEAALCLVQLGGGDTEVENDSLEWGAICSEPGHVTKAAAPSLEAFAESSQATAGCREGCRVSIEAEDLSLRVNEECFSVPTPAQCAVQIVPIGMDSDELRDRVA